MKKYILSFALLCAIGSVAYAGGTSNYFINLATQVFGTLPVANGGTGLVAVGTSGLCVLSNGTGLEYGSCGGTAGAGGTDRQMQFNDGTVLAGTAFLTVGTNALSQGLTTFTAKPTFVTVGTTTASINIPVGTQAPSSPVSGDVWVTDGLYVRVGTTTQGPLGAGGAGGSGTTNSYTSSGAIDVTDSLSLVTGTSGTLAMTLGASSTDLHPLIIKRYGAAVVTVVATIDGTSQTITMGTPYTYEALKLTWSSGQSSWIQN